MAIEHSNSIVDGRPCPAAPKKTSRPRRNGRVPGKSRNLINNFLVCPPAPRKQPCESKGMIVTLCEPKNLFNEFCGYPSAPRKQPRARAETVLFGNPRKLLDDFLVCPSAPRKPPRVRAELVLLGEPQNLLIDFNNA